MNFKDELCASHKFLVHLKFQGTKVHFTCWMAGQLALFINDLHYAVVNMNLLWPPMHTSASTYIEITWACFWLGSRFHSSSHLFWWCGMVVENLININFSSSNVQIIANVITTVKHLLSYSKVKKEENMIHFVILISPLPFQGSSSLCIATVDIDVVQEIYFFIFYLHYK